MRMETRRREMTVDVAVVLQVGADRFEKVAIQAQMVMA